MTEPMNPEYRDHARGIDWTALKTTLVADHFDHGRTSEQMRRSFQKSQAVSLALLEGMIVGTARALSDGVSNAYVVDVWTLSRLRRQGIARAMIARLLKRLPGQHVYLHADEDVIEFYQRIGFVEPRFEMSSLVGRWLVHEQNSHEATTESP